MIENPTKSNDRDLSEGMQQRERKMKGKKRNNVHGYS